MSERVIHLNELEIATEAFGDPAHAPLLLIMGAMASMLWWPRGFCERLANRGRYVIRYDNRDTGLSTKYAPGAPDYTFDDMVGDAIRVLDGYRIPAAHLAGMSLGGMIGQLAALKHPSRVLSLTAISTSPVGMDTSDLPGSSAAYMERAAAGDQVDWSDGTEVIAYMVQDSRMLAGTAHPFDEGEVRAFIGDDYDRSGGYLSATNHFILKSGDERKYRVHAMKAPLLVIHGTADPLISIEHGLALSQAVGGSTFFRIEGDGHELHRADWDTIVDAMARHTGAR